MLENNWQRGPRATASGAYESIAFFPFCQASWDFNTSRSEQNMRLCKRHFQMRLIAEYGWISVWILNNVGMRASIKHSTVKITVSSMRLLNIVTAYELAPDIARSSATVLFIICNYAISPLLEIVPDQLSLDTAIYSNISWKKNRHVHVRLLYKSNIMTGSED